MKPVQLWIAGVLVLAWGAGCRTTPPQARFDPRASGAAILTNFTAIEREAQMQALLGTPTNFFTLGPGDRVEIEIFGELPARSDLRIVPEPDLPEARRREPVGRAENTTRATATVGPDGKIYYYLLPGLDVWGLTLAETKALLERELGQYLNEPKVGITLRAIESKRVWLLGRFENPGVYPMAAPMTLLEAISLAGGTMSSNESGTTEELADLRHSFIMREGKMLAVDFHELLMKGAMPHNIYLQADDFVYVPSALSREVYVLGAVRSPKAVSLGQPITLISAIASAGGTIKDAYLSHVAIVRGSLSEPKIAVVNFRDIVKGQAADVILEPRDIVYVPLSPYRTLVRYAELIVTTFARAVAINEGTRAVTENAAPVGVGITVSP